MHQKIDDNYSWEETRPMWLCRLENDLVDHVYGGWSNEWHKINAITFLGMVEVEQILAPILKSETGPIHVFWPKGSCERLDVTFISTNECEVVWWIGKQIKDEFVCTPLGLRNTLTKFYPFVKNNFDRKFIWTGRV